MEQSIRRLAPPVIGICSPGPGHGKNTLASATVDLLGDACIVSFATALRKEIAKELRKLIGLPTFEIQQLLTVRKSESIPRLGNTTGRQLLQEHGAAKRALDKAYWLKKWLQAARRCKDAGLIVVCDDVRYLNEAHAITEMGGELWRIERPSKENDPRVMSHESERDMFEFRGYQRLFINDGTIQDLQDEVRCSLQALPYVREPVCAEAAQ